MLNFLIGAACAAVLYTFFPSLAVYPSMWLHRAWEWLKSATSGS